ncbi:molybdate ABC transporter substrate-binding protein [Candidatus Methanoliparum sp. LAM-1]|uniref:molybdate ABC transporter substrate-binding protein n=1 Tax=Candidatus Methanoliparum sp. LAM-1 TaxID=2874846 RepID=UPI001E30A798|nr:molybdate ABC transporter substrate-binding protein [Candidatus Methanoliparum sp. LAM-1]BDC36085.1 molybdenum ABC transporter substrate-binding protein [Candidatus Methanoliparum sp. LAM-1]
MKRRDIILIVSVSIVAILSLASYYGYNYNDQKIDEERLLIYSGAGLKPVMDEIADKFEEKTGITVDIIYGGSGHIFGQLSLSQRGDIFIPGGKYYTERAIEEGLVYKNLTKDVVYHIPCIIVKDDNPKGITSLEDLSKPGVKVALGNKDRCAIGRVSKEILEREGLYDIIRENNLEVETATVNELLVYIPTGVVDAAIVWKETLVDDDKIEVIEIDPAKNIIETIPASVTRCTENLDTAKEFLNFITSEEGLKIWREKGFKPIE